LVLDFLRQVSKAMPTLDDSGSRLQSQSKVALKLADRRKPMKEDGSPATRLLLFPHNAKHSSSRAIAQVLRTVELMHEALVTGVPTTKRLVDMYYKDVPLFGSQVVVDKLVDDIAATLSVGRADLNVRASSKGLVSGRGLTMHLYEEDSITVSTSESTLIPVSEEIERFEVEDDLSWVLVVEKEAVFQTLCRLNLAEHSRLPGPGLLITGKGYPDVATRQLVRTLSDNLPAAVPIISLVDCDPWGIDILSVYKYGSASMVHEHKSLVASRIVWGGVRGEDISLLGLNKDAMLPITKHDQKKAMAILRRTDLPGEWKTELQHMLHSRRKAEIEVLSSMSPVLGPQQVFSMESMQDEDIQHRRNSLLEYTVCIIAKAVDNARRKYATQGRRVV
ncbi:uncharacterized protein PHACADRAFT_96783, partial [Phanerochaete carnosa HHB-10118-sp]